MIEISHKLCDIPVSAPLAISIAEREQRLAGHDVISFCVGEPDFPVSPAASHAGTMAILNGETRYTNATGTDELKQAISGYLQRRFVLDYSINEIAVTTGAKYAAYATVRALCDDGDEVLLPAPYWTSYRSMSELAGARVKILPCSASNGYKLTPQQLEKAADERTKLLILNNPNNPSGAVYSRDELEKLYKVAERIGIAVLADEIYSDFVYDGEFCSAPSISDFARENTVLISGMSKNWAMTGWRIGFVAAPQQVIKAVGAMLSHTTGCPNAISQAAAAAALAEKTSEAQKNIEDYRERRDVMYRALKDMGIAIAKPKGAFYALADMREFITDEQDDLAIALRLLRDGGVSTVPCTQFGLPGFLRLSFTVPCEKLNEGMKRLAVFVERLRGEKNG